MLFESEYNNWLNCNFPSESENKKLTEKFTLIISDWQRFYFSRLGFLSSLATGKDSVGLQGL